MLDAAPVLNPPNYRNNANYVHPVIGRALGPAKPIWKTLAYGSLQIPYFLSNDSLTIKMCKT